jgi:hypothetical protein
MNNLVATGNYAEIGATAVGLVDSIASGVAATDLVAKAGLSAAATSQSGTEAITAFGKNNVLVGGSAATVVTAAGQNNLVATGAGNDVITAAGSKTGIVAGAGNDVVTAIGTYNVVVAGEGNNIVTTLGKGNLVEGGSGNDVLTALAFGSAAKVNVNGNVLLAGDGNNVATVVGKDNAVVTGSGKDVLVMIGYGGSNTKESTSQPEGSQQTTTTQTTGSTQLNVGWTGAGNDTAVVYGDHNVVLADSGDDVLVVLNAGSKLSYSSKTTEAIEGSDKSQEVSSTKVSIDTGMNFVHAGAGNDTMVLAGTTTIGMGGDGNDLIVSSGQNNIAVGGAGNDVIVGLAESTVFNAAEALVENEYESAGDWVGAAMNAKFIKSQYGSLAKGDLNKLNLVGNVIVGGDGNDTIFATNAGTYVGGGKGNDVMMGLGWGVVDKLLVGHGNAISGAMSDLGAGFDAVTKYLNKALGDELSKGWDGLSAAMKAELSKAASNAGDLVDDLNSAGSSAVNAISGVAGLGSADFDIASALKSAINGGKSGLEAAINGIGNGVDYVADADVGSAISTAVNWSADAISTASDASGSGINWLGKQLGINLGLSDFKGMDFLLSGFIAYTVGYKYAGNNRLWGGAGDDTFYSGMGNDDLHGGEGNDVYVMSMGDGKDTIHEAAGDADILRFTGNKLFDKLEMTTANVKVNFEGSALVINYVSDGKSYAQFTVEDYKSAGIAKLEVVSAAGSTVGTLTLAQLEALGQQGESPYAMASVWTADRMHDFADLVGNALTGQAG